MGVVVFAVRKATAKNQAQPNQITVVMTSLPCVHVLPECIIQFHIL